MIASSVLATLDLSDEMQRYLVGALQRMHGCNHSVFGRIRDMHRDGCTLHVLTRLRRGAHCVVRWSFTATTIGMQWNEYRSAQAARQAFYNQIGA